MQNTTILLLCFVVAASQAFFLTSKDVRKILQYFPKAFDPEGNQKNSPIPYRRRENDYHYHQQHAYRPEYISDFYDRNDNGENRRKNPKTGKTPGRSDYNRVYHDKTHPGTQYHSHEDCDHPEHHRPKYPEDRMEKVDNSRAAEVNADYQNVRKHYQEYKKKLSEIEKDYEGVLVSIPKIKNDEDVEGYYKGSPKHQNVFLHHLLKTEVEDEQPSRQHVAVDDDKSYLY